MICLSLSVVRRPCQRAPLHQDPIIGSVGVTMMNINRDVVAFKRQADDACAAMKEAKGQIAMYRFVLLR